MAKKIQYAVLCAWCEKKGKRTIVGVADEPGSHGVCPDCEKEYQENLAKALNEKKKD